MPFSSMEAVMAEELPLGAGSSLQVHLQWQWYQCLMLRHLWSGHGADIWSVNALGAAMELGSRMWSHTKLHTRVHEHSHCSSGSGVCTRHGCSQSSHGGLSHVQACGGSDPGPWMSQQQLLLREKSGAATSSSLGTGSDDDY